MRYLVDTNVLLRWSDADSPHYQECVGAVKRLIDMGGQPCSCAQVLIEFWVAATRPREVNGFGMDSLRARQTLSEVRRVFVCLPEHPDMADRWESVVSKHQVLGKQAHDARLVALMLSHDVTQLLTLNTSDFARYPEIKPLTPAEAPRL